MKALPYKYYFSPVFLLTILGIADTSYLAISHYRNYTDIAYASFCAISQSFNCDTVAQSSWSVLFGLPVALWGLTGYLLYFSLLVTVRESAEESMPLWSILQILGLVYSITALMLGYISAQKIHSYCLMCILSYGISFLLFFYPLIIRSRFSKKNFIGDLIETLPIVSNNFPLKSSIASLVILITLMQLYLPHYWIHEYPSNFSSIGTGITEERHPWIGSDNPDITIEEFTDYQCFQCGKLHYFLRKLVEQYPEKIRLIHHNYPLDHRYNPILAGKPFHIGSGELALLANYASSKGRFWEMNDHLYKALQTRHSTSIDLNKLAEKLALPVADLEAALQSPVFKERLTIDIQQGMQSGITATPAYIVNGQVFIGSIPSTTLQNLEP